MPTETALARRRRWRQQRAFLIAAALVAGAAVTTVLSILVDPRSLQDGREVGTLQAVAGWCIAAAGLTLQVWGLALQLLGSRRTRPWSGPLTVLSRGQRRHLIAVVSRRQALDSAPLPLARLTAEQLVQQGYALASNVGLTLPFSGTWIADPSTWRGVLVLFMVAMNLLAGIFLLRDARRGRSFLRVSTPTTADA
ncbi:hypothetical protein [Geodermatophilus amargosae]|nr:hypothetical protein [Geodermatophilus amargosae]